MAEIFYLDDSIDYDAGSSHDQEWAPEEPAPKTIVESGKRKKRKQENANLKRRRATVEQRLQLLSLVEENPSLTMELKAGDSVTDFTQRWSEVAHKLNTIEGPIKSGQQWRRLWVDMVVYLKSKIFSHTSQEDLTDYERRVCEIYRDHDDFPKLKGSTSSGPVVRVGLGRIEVGLHSPSRSPSPPPLPKSEYQILLEDPMEKSQRASRVIVFLKGVAITSGIPAADDGGAIDLKRRWRDNELSCLQKTQVTRLDVLALNSEILDSQSLLNSEVENIAGEMKRIADILEKCFDLYRRNGSRINFFPPYKMPLNSA